MKKTILAIILATTSAMTMASIDNNPAFTNTSNPEYNGNMYNSNAMSNVQVNNSSSSYTSMGNITCPTGTWTMGTAQNITNIESGSNASSGTILLTYNHPTDLNGTVSRCVKAQKAQVRLMEQENDFNVIRNCIAAKNANITLDPTVFSWARKCSGVLDFK